jgi:PAS domain S-box-containing protein
MKLSEDVYSNIVENTHDAVGIIQDCKLLFVNKAGVELLGFPKKDILNKSIEKFVHPDDFDNLYDYYQNVLINFKEGIPYYFRVVRGDGTTIWVETVTSAIKIGEEQKPAALFFLMNERIDKILVEKISEAVVVLQDAKFVYANKKALDILETTQEEILGKIFLDVIHPDDQAMTKTRYEKRISGEDLTDLYVFRVVTKSKDVRYMLLSATVIEWRGKKATLNLLTDVTEQRKMEENLKRLERMESLGVLAGGVAHDLNNQLGIINVYTELLLLKTDENNPIRRDIEQIISGTLKAIEITQDLLSISQKTIYVESILNVNNIILKCQKDPQYEKIMNGHPISVELDLKSQLNILGASDVLYKTFLTLISNSLIYMRRNGEKECKLKISTEDKYLSKPITGYAHVSKGEYVVITIESTSRGLSPENVMHLFEPFYIKKVLGIGETGLEMSVVWASIKDHNGYIDVQSKENEGTKYTLYFPVTRSDVVNKRLSESLSWYVGQGQKVLVIDNDEEQRKLATIMLTKLNYNPTTVASGKDALKYLEENKADIIILDMIMDLTLDGLDVSKKILNCCPEQKIIVITGYPEGIRHQEVKNIGIADYIKKPYRLDNLGLALYKVLNNK